MNSSFLQLVRSFGKHLTKFTIFAVVLFFAMLQSDAQMMPQRSSAKGSILGNVDMRLHAAAAVPSVSGKTAAQLSDNSKNQLSRVTSAINLFRSEEDTSELT